MNFDDFIAFISFFSPKVVPLNWKFSNFGTTVLEGFYDLPKFLETSISHMDKVHAHQFSEPSVIGAQRNRFSNLASQFLPRSI